MNTPPACSRSRPTGDAIQQCRHPSEHGLEFLPLTGPPSWAAMRQDAPRRARESHALQGTPPDYQSAIQNKHQHLLNPTCQAYDTHSYPERA